MNALAVFHGEGAHWASPVLRPGFRHVFVCILSEGYWILFDPKAGDVEFRVLCGADYDLAGFYRERGFTVVGIERKNTVIKWPFMLRNCVGAAKAVLGVSHPLVWTPWQLYKVLTHDRSFVSGHLSG